MSFRVLSLLVPCCLMISMGLDASAQTSTSVLIGNVTAKQVSEGLGFNLDPGQDWQWAAAAAAGASYARIQCAWSNVEQQTAPPQNASAANKYIEDPNCAAGFASAARYGMHPTVVAAYGPPWHTILNVSVPGGAPVGATSFTIEMNSGTGGENLSDVKFPYDYFCAAASSTLCASPITSRHSYQGTLITGVTQVDSTHARISLASALTRSLPADGTSYLVQEILYPSATNANATDPSVEAYANYVSFLAQDIAAHGLTGDVEIWNEPPWTNDPWDARSSLYDSGLYTGPSQFGANFGFAANLMGRTFPNGVTATWNGTSGSANGSLLSSNMLLYSGTTLKMPSTTITRESSHPYSSADGNPEDDLFLADCLQREVGASHPTNCALPGTENSANLWQEIFYSLDLQKIDPSFGLGHSITETNELPPHAGMQIKQAQANLRQFLGFEADGITPVEFFRLCNGPTADPSYSFVNTASCITPSYTPTPAYTALAGVISDLKQIGAAPAQAYTAASLPTIGSYSGTYALATTNMVGARAGATANSDAFMVWQISACTNAAGCWYNLPSPAAAPVTVQLPSGLKVTAVTDLVTRKSVDFTASGQQVSFKVTDNPVEVMLDPASYTQARTSLSVSSNPGSSTYGQQVVLTAKLSPSSAAAQTTDGETVQFYTDSSVLGTAKLSGGVANFGVTSFPAGVDRFYASYGGDDGFAASSASGSISVVAATPALALPALGPQTLGEGLFPILATSNSPAPISYQVISGGAWISGSTPATGAMVKPTGLGTVVFQASQPATGSFTATTARVSFTVVGESPSLYFNSVADKLFGASGPFSVSTVSRSSGAVTYSIASGPARISGNVVTLTGSGTVVVNASQAAAGNYAAASAQTSVLVTGQTPTILTIPPVGTQTIGEGMFTIAAHTNSPGLVTYKVLSGGAWIGSQTAGGASLKPTAVGPVVVQASQAASGNYASATATVSFNVQGESPSLTWNPVGTKLYGSNAPFAVSAYSHSSAAITYSVLSGPAQISGNTVTLTGGGTVVLQASQAASGNFAVATAQTSFLVNAQITPSLALPAVANQTMGGGLFPVLATSNSPAPIQYRVLSGGAWISSTSTTGALVKATAVGPVVFQASQAATGNYAATSTQITFNVLGQSPSLAWNQIGTKGLSNTLPFNVSAYSRSPGLISYSVVSGPASLQGNQITVKGLGRVVLQATQLASGGYSAATAQTSFSIN